MKKIALVTGSTGGIGTAISSKFVSDNYRVIATYSSTEYYKDSIKWFNQQNFSEEHVRLFRLDVANTTECLERLTSLLKEEGCIDIIVNNAGITRDSVFKKMSAKSWYEVIETNLNSLFNVIQPLFGSMCDKGMGRIINVSSVNALKGQFGQANYCAAKAGMIGFSKALAEEGAKFGVTVNVVAPGYTSTPMIKKIKSEILESIKYKIPMKRFANPEEIANTVSFLASESAAYITGATLSVNGGLYMQ
ncbi:acetoacetyl-CoA reductase [Candidatus Photodesmus katoptron]|uniref:Acetoacetyl-CoA reductase n=1 Tax=Candidatus Photodesmus katoptron Akat1 TaxID=1236703 RepID=S3DGT1_9GAMM|nr:SDR family oxidoreductase [Candidatus Photodesmus katoptron]EPE37677.1 acetoacetyl-CoA reductase [Candidatus Photodesmus katoptron Akat1]KEY90603.1 acetoacetyl-CoA reductase [Candidatus Photodesmus katoptron]